LKLRFKEGKDTDSSIITYFIIGVTHINGFYVLLTINKWWLKKSISDMKLIVYYIIIFLVGVLIFQIISNFNILESILGLEVFGIVFFIWEFIILKIWDWSSK
jgi:hypothetical protein